MSVGGFRSEINLLKSWNKLYIYIFQRYRLIPSGKDCTRQDMDIKTRIKLMYILLVSFINLLLVYFFGDHVGD